MSAATKTVGSLAASAPCGSGAVLAANQEPHGRSWPDIAAQSPAASHPSTTMPPNRAPTDLVPGRATPCLPVPPCDRRHCTLHCTLTPREGQAPANRRFSAILGGLCGRPCRIRSVLAGCATLCQRTPNRAQVCHTAELAAVRSLPAVPRRARPCHVVTKPVAHCIAHSMEPAAAFVAAPSPGWVEPPSLRRPHEPRDPVRARYCNPSHGPRTVRRVATPCAPKNASGSWPAQAQPVRPSGNTSKPASRGHFKTSQSKVADTRCVAIREDEARRLRSAI